jgi:hypothetical protein
MKKQTRGFRARLARLVDELWYGSTGWEQEREELLAKIANIEKNLAKETKWVKTFENAMLASRQEVLGHEMALDIERKTWCKNQIKKDERIDAFEHEILNLIDLNAKKNVQLIVVTSLFFAVSVWAVIEYLVLHGTIS